MSRSYPTQPLLGVGAAVWRSGQILMMRRRNDPGSGRWSLPGGLMQLGETLAEAAAREVLEETGVIAAVGAPLHLYDVIERDAAGRVAWQFVIAVHHASWLAGEPMAGDDADMAMFMSPDAALALDLWPEIREAIMRSRTLLAGQTGDR